MLGSRTYLGNWKSASVDSYCLSWVFNLIESCNNWVVISVEGSISPTDSKWSNGKGDNRKCERGFQESADL